jgi:hypothetical protein
MEKNRVAITESQLFASNKMHKYINQAVNAWTNYANTPGVPDNSGLYYVKALKIAQDEANKLNCSVEFDYPGLYPTYEIVKDGKHYTEYTVESFFKRINGFWD